jgi:hypothetical protein
MELACPELVEEGEAEIRPSRGGPAGSFNRDPHDQDLRDTHDGDLIYGKENIRGHDSTQRGKTQTGS